MSDFFEKEQDTSAPDVTAQTADETALDEVETTIITEQESTVFSAPVEHKKTAPKNVGKKRLISIIAACVAVAVLVGGTLFAKEFVKKMAKDENVTSFFEDITVIDTDSKAFTAVTVTNKNGDFKFVTQQINVTNTDGNNESTTYWTVEGIDVSKLSSTSTNSIIAAASNIIAKREIKTKTPSECGFDSPKFKIAVTSSACDPFTILVGDASPDSLGSYMMLEGDEKIYVVADEEFSEFDFKLLDLTDKTSIPITTFASNTADNKTADGTYAFFDSLTLSGKLFPEMITIINNQDKSDSAALLPYLITTPSNRYANSENLTSLVSLFSTENAVAGNYALDVTDETLKLYGLDNPDAIVTMTIDGDARTFKFSIIDDEYSAVVYDGAPMIRKVITSNFAFLSLKPEDLYHKNLFMYSINDIKSLKFNDSEGNTNFDISYEEVEGSDKVYHVLANGKEIVADNFQDFYADFVGTQCTDFTTQDVSAKPDGTVTFVFYDDSEIVIDFYRVNDTEYQYHINGNAMGKITSSAYQKAAKNIKSIAAGEEPV